MEINERDSRETHQPRPTRKPKCMAATVLTRNRPTHRPEYGNGGIKGEWNVRKPENANPDVSRLWSEGTLRAVEDEMRDEISKGWPQYKRPGFLRKSVPSPGSGKHGATGG